MSPKPATRRESQRRRVRSRHAGRGGRPPRPGASGLEGRAGARAHLPDRDRRRGSRGRARRARGAGAGPRTRRAARAGDRLDGRGRPPPDGGPSARSRARRERRIRVLDVASRRLARGTRAGRHHAGTRAAGSRTAAAARNDDLRALPGAPRRGVAQTPARRARDLSRGSRATGAASVPHPLGLARPLATHPARRCWWCSRAASRELPSSQRCRGGCGCPRRWPSRLLRRPLRLDLHGLLDGGVRVRRAAPGRRPLRDHPQRRDAHPVRATPARGRPS